MPVTKKYVDEFQIGGSPKENLGFAVEALHQAGFKKVSEDERLNRVSADWKPIIGTLWGDITVTLVQSGKNTTVQLVSVAGVDNIYTVAKSPGKRIFEKFISQFSVLTRSPDPEGSTTIASESEISSQLRDLAKMLGDGLLSPEEFQKAKAKLLGD